MLDHEFDERVTRPRVLIAFGHEAVQFEVAYGCPAVAGSAAGIPGAEFVPIDGVNHAVMSDEPGWQQTLDAIDTFLPSRPRPRQRADFGRLTPRQLEILHLLAQGSANADIAEQLHLSQKTVRNQVSAIFDQLGVRSRGQAIVLAREAGFGQG